MTRTAHLLASLYDVVGMGLAQQHNAAPWWRVQVTCSRGGVVGGQSVSVAYQSGQPKQVASGEVWPRSLHQGRFIMVMVRMCG
ncbi:MAG: hypothetical protein O7C59_05570, partial [Rickettsia endosymbiont of Ixodes persulcatus]|nr:hypothetical protein [Rickettsia endosymbiont of Ixodes persulcatus]